MTSRISQSMLYTNFLNYLNQTTSSLQKLYEQGSSGKKINRPSDNPVGMARILSYRDSIKALSKYQDNINNAKGWLGLADTTLSQVEDQLTRLKELAVQTSTGTLNEKDRKDALNEVKQIFEQLVALSNTTYEGRSIFAGHRIHSPAYTKSLAVFSNKKDETGSDDVNAYIKDIQGSTDDIVVIEFSKTGAASARIGIDNGINYTVTKGDTIISTGTLNAGNTSIDLGGVKLDFKEGYRVICDENLAGEDRTKLIIAPTAIYNGDNESGIGVEIDQPGTYNNLSITPEKNGSFEQPVKVKITAENPNLGDGGWIEYEYSLDGGKTWSNDIHLDYSAGDTSITLKLPGGNVKIDVLDPTSPAQLDGLEFTIGGVEVEQTSTNLYAFAKGDLQKDVVVRIDNITGAGTPPTGFASGDVIEYSYSLDGGETWDTGHKIIASGTISDYQIFPIPGGILKIAPNNATSSLSVGDQFVVHPRDASIDSEISENISIPVNNVGTRIFGGYYKNRDGYEMAFMGNEEKNLFVGVGKLIAALELNDQEGIRKTLDYLDASLSQVTKVHAEIGAKINRLNTSDAILSDLKLNQTERKSFIEDVDFADLLTKISQQQTVYQAVLKSASMIMKISLVNYV